VSWHAVITPPLFGHLQRGAGAAACTHNAAVGEELSTGLRASSPHDESQRLEAYTPAKKKKKKKKKNKKKKKKNKKKNKKKKRKKKKKQNSEKSVKTVDRAT